MSPNPLYRIKTDIQSAGAFLHAAGDATAPATYDAFAEMFQMKFALHGKKGIDQDEIGYVANRVGFFTSCEDATWMNFFLPTTL